jgi:hypothetical protein
MIFPTIVFAAGDKDASRHGDVERFDGAGTRNVDQFVATRSNPGPNPLALVAHHEH